MTPYKKDFRQHKRVLRKKSDKTRKGEKSNTSISNLGFLSVSRYYFFFEKKKTHKNVDNDILNSH